MRFGVPGGANPALASITSAVEPSPIVAGLAGILFAQHPAWTPRQVATQIRLSADPIDAQEAHRIGLVNEVVEPARLLARAEEILRKIEANGPLAIRLCMEAVNRGLEVSLAEGLVLERTLFGLSATSSDKTEGTSAFLEKRPAKFTGQ